MAVKDEWRKSTRSGENGGACVEVRVVRQDAP
ncbi:DUF397 domain-containing protein [Actinoallomurus iriomotensis]